MDDVLLLPEKSEGSPACSSLFMSPDRLVLLLINATNVSAAAESKLHEEKRKLALSSTADAGTLRSFE